MIRVLASTSMKGIYALDVLKSDDTVMAKCSSQPECRHRLIFQRLDDGNWKSTNIDVGHCHKKGKESRSLFLPPSARAKRRKLDKDRGVTRTPFDPGRPLQRDTSIHHDIGSNGHQLGSSGSPVGGTRTPLAPSHHPAPKHPTPTQTPASPLVTTPAGHQSTLDPSRTLLPPLTKTRRTVRPRANSSDREEGSASLIRLRDMYHGDGPEHISECESLIISLSPLSCAYPCP